MKNIKSYNQFLNENFEIDENLNDLLQQASVILGEEPIDADDAIDKLQFASGDKDTINSLIAELEDYIEDEEELVEDEDLTNES